MSNESIINLLTYKPEVFEPVIKFKKKKTTVIPISKDEQQTSPTTINSGRASKLSDAGILKALETAMDEMVRFEVSDQSPYSSQMKKIFEFKDYFMDYLIMQYGFKNRASKTYDFID